MVGELAAAREGIGLAGEDGEEDVDGRDAPRQRHSHVAVVGEDPVGGAVEGHGRGHLHRLVPGGADHERSPTLAVEGPHPVVHAAGCEHQAVHLDHLLVFQAQGGVVEGDAHGSLLSDRCCLLRSPISAMRRSATCIAASMGVMPRSAAAVRMRRVAS